MVFVPWDALEPNPMLDYEQIWYLFTRRGFDVCVNNLQKVYFGPVNISVGTNVYGHKRGF